jgi:diguanylate cyclase (GGDEF)-like protein
MEACEIVPQRSPEPGAPPPLPRILLVEDNPGDAELIQILLERNVESPLLVHCVPRLDRAIACLRADTFAAIVLDLGLPDCHGIETLTAIQRHAAGTPIIVLTELCDFELSLMAVRQGAQDYLSKGLLCGELLARSIRFALERTTILAEVTSDSLTDELTGLYNRRGFMALAAPVFKAARRYAGDTKLVYLDLDGLKPINDLLGHDVGDQVLREAAQTLREVFRESDIVARLGGDEFAVLALGESASTSTILSQLDAQIGEHNAEPGRNYRLSISAGAVTYEPQRHGSFEALLQEGDRLMYEQKRAKRNSLAGASG